MLQIDGKSLNHCAASERIRILALFDAANSPSTHRPNFSVELKSRQLFADLFYCSRFGQSPGSLLAVAGQPPGSHWAATGQELDDLMCNQHKVKA